MRIFLDADACPAKDQVYRVAARYAVAVAVVANARLRLPDQADLEMIVVPGGIDVADDWIAEHACADDLVLTADIPLAARALRAGARCLDFRGSEFDSNRIGDALANRDINAYLRSLGLSSTSVAAYSPRDRSRFASKLDAVVSQATQNRASSS
ncbi:MAG: YaiI/YqxD family protein [Chloroflexota bacterium]|nr:YaiI/YqxD family protein [Chloroflexota bacterium]